MRFQQTYARTGAISPENTHTFCTLWGKGTLISKDGVRWIATKHGTDIWNSFYLELIR